ncbi:peptidyl-tRNA hydrolase domain-containing protein [Pyrenochaeta sp. DS3sAY3a]|nr:peptidyl-tRNA hydrolase domain-containing protein [Pyrenochaeta sp. DS3sAY3a]
MLSAGPRARLRALISSPRCSPPTPVVHRPFSSSQHGGGSASDDELHAARTWLAKLHAESIPLRNIGELSFSRSSGPGGQNHTKRVNSKATLKVPLDALLEHVPTALHAELRRSRYVAAKSQTIIVQADDSRKQSDNANSCYKRLYEAIVQVGHSAVPNQTSSEQLQRVKTLQRSDNERRLKTKKQQSARKSSRRSRGDD